MEKWKKRALALVTDIAFRGKKYPAVVPYSPQKTTVSGLEEPYFKRTSPERHGISSLRIAEMLKALEGEAKINIHSILILKDGEVISETSAPGYGVNIRYLSHSMSKTLTGMAIGMLSDDGGIELDTPITRFFPEYEPKDKRFAEITVRHLLTMSSGVSFSEVGSVTETEWTKAFFESGMDFAPGEMFAYNSMNSYILAAIVVRVSGMSLLDFLKIRLFGPLKIKNVFWEIGPEDIEKGGWGVHLSVESWAKIGFMMLSGGVFEGKRILSEKWVSESLSTHMHAPDSTGDFNYGYQLWVAKENSEFLFSGMLGQNVWCCPKNNIVAVITAGNNSLFQKNPGLSIIKKYLGGDLSEKEPAKPWDYRILRKAEKDFYETKRRVNPKEIQKGIPYILGFKNAKPYDTAWDGLLGKYIMRSNNHGILPLFIRAMQNNYSGGIDSFSFKRENDHIVFTSTEDGKSYDINSGFYEYASSVINVNGEKYAVRSMCEAVRGEDGKTVYTIDIVFPEVPNSRKIIFEKNGEGELTAKMTEMPDQNLAEPLVEAIYTTNPKLSFIVSIIENRLGDRFVARKLESLFNPTLKGIDETKIESLAPLSTDEIDSDMELLSSIILQLAENTDDE